MIRPTPRAMVLGLLAFAASTILVLIFEAGFAALLPFAGVALLILLDAGRLPTRRHLSIELDMLAYLEVDMATTGRLSLTSYRQIPHKVEAKLRGEGEAIRYALRTSNVPTERGKQEWILDVQGVQRGQTELTELRLELQTAFGIAQGMVRLPIDRQIRVNTSTKGAKQATLTLQRRGTMFGSRAQLLKGQGSEFDAMREFQNGMDPRLIDWKQTARRGTLIAKEMRLEQNHQVYLVFDTGYLLSTQVDGVSKLDHAINAGLAIGWVASQQGDQVGCYAYDAQPRLFATAKRGKAGYATLKYQLGVLQPAPVETNPTHGLTHLRQRLNRRALIIVFTDFVDATTSELMVSHLQLMARDHLVAFVALKNRDLEATIWQDPEEEIDLSHAVMAADIQANRQLVLAKLRAAGLFCLDVEPANLTTDLLNTYLSIRERQLQ